MREGGAGEKRSQKRFGQLTPRANHATEGGKGLCLLPTQ